MSMSGYSRGSATAPQQYTPQHTSMITLKLWDIPLERTQTCYYLGFAVELVVSSQQQQMS